MKLTTIQQEWDDFAAKVGLSDAPDIQIQEMRRAFFAGQFAMFMFQMTEMCNLPDSLSELALDTRQRELKDFFSNFKNRN